MIPRISSYLLFLPLLLLSLLLHPVTSQTPSPSSSSLNALDQILLTSSIPPDILSIFSHYFPSSLLTDSAAVASELSILTAEDGVSAIGGSSTSGSAQTTSMMGGSSGVARSQTSASLSSSSSSVLSSSSALPSSSSEIVAASSPISSSCSVSSSSTSKSSSPPLSSSPLHSSSSPSPSSSSTSSTPSSTSSDASNLRRRSGSLAALVSTAALCWFVLL
ncbi:hypothetical protein BZA70DRAFT_290160 [Myxozyma melibiosi]|uniref:Uncharacterized protein n=1 Tax=Myxozyma melibiosi TaxID=54550 RepID=A0ABR1F4S1_9ASCO